MPSRSDGKENEDCYEFFCNFDDELCDYPHIKLYISKLHSTIRHLTKLLAKHRKLKKQKRAVKFCDMGFQSEDDTMCKTTDEEYESDSTFWSAEENLAEQDLSQANYFYGSKSGMFYSQKNNDSMAGSKRRKKYLKKIRRQQEKCADKGQERSLQDSGQYLHLNESQESDLLTVLNCSLSVLHQSDDNIFVNGLVPRALELKSTIDTKLSNLTSEESAKSSAGFNLWITCRYCGSECQTCDWKNHILHRCDYAGPSKTRLKTEIYKISGNSIECLLCGESCSTIDEKRAHDYSFDHLKALKNVNDNIDPHSIFCSMCRVDVPNNPIQCLFHLKSVNHMLLARSYSDWYKEGVRYISFNSNIQCLTCNQFFIRNDIRLHHEATHQADKSKTFWLIDLCGPDNVWCEACCCQFDISRFESHQCGSTSLEFHCQMCSASVLGVSKFAMHIKNCLGNRKPALLGNHSFFSFLDSDPCQVQCFYCNGMVLESKFYDHFKFQCSGLHEDKAFDPVFKVQYKISVFKLTHLLVICDPCGIKFSSLLELEEHKNSFGHSIKCESKVKNYDKNVIYCLICQESIPYYDHLNFCFGHVSSSKHKRLVIDRISNFFDRIGYIAHVSNARCLICNENFNYCDLLNHHTAHHKIGSLGVLKLQYDDIWCTSCSSVLWLEDIKSHRSGVCRKSSQVRYCQLCNNCVEGNVNFVEHIKNCSFPTEISDVSANFQFTNSDQSGSDCTVCNGCGMTCGDLARHLAVECTDPYNPVIKTQGKKSAYEVTNMGLKCHLCNVSKLCTIKEHEDTTDHNHKNTIDFNLETIFCVVCLEALPVSVNVQEHINSTRHSTIVFLQKNTINVGFIGYSKKIQCLRCSGFFSAADDELFNLHIQGCSAPLDVWCSLCNLEMHVYRYFRHASSCNKSFQDFTCQLCQKVFGRLIFEEHLKNCVKSKLNPNSSNTPQAKENCIIL